MSKISCVCGHVFNDGESPSEQTHLVRDRDMKAYAHHMWQTYQLSDVERGGMLPEKGTVESDQFHSSLYACLELQGELWDCPECDRLLLRRPGEKNFRTFTPSSTPGAGAE